MNADKMAFRKIVESGDTYETETVAFTPSEIEKNFRWVGPHGHTFGEAKTESGSLALLEQKLQEKGGLTLKDLEDQGWFRREDA